MRLAQFFLLLMLAAAPPLAAAPSAPASAFETPRQAYESLLAADRAFAATASDDGLIAALTTMFDTGVVMPAPGGKLVSGRAAAVDAIRANPDNITARAAWKPAGGGIAADGRHGFTYGFMTVTTEGKPPLPLKYLAYWVRRSDGWRVAAYKRLRRPAVEASAAAFPVTVPEQAAAAAGAASPTALASLKAAERAFSDRAQEIGLRAAFAEYGLARSINLGQGAGITIGALAISEEVGPSASASPVRWSADGALVASSGDLGVTWGLIRPNAPPPEGQPAAIPFFTIWTRESASAPWRYIAE